MKTKKIVWGICWLNEPVETVIDFLNNSILALTKMSFDVYPIIFDARYKHCKEDNNAVSMSVKNVVIIENHFNVYPNKNYGIAVISVYANQIDANFLAIVDPDWNVKEFSSFINNLICPVINEETDIVIPDIGYEAGRSNLLIGKVAMSLFYPEYYSVIKTAFPGALIGLTSKISSISLSHEYHYDWGGEWDIISYAIKNGYIITSMPIEVTNVRHRANSSKVLDAYQIWRAIFANEDFIKRYDNIFLYNEIINPKDDFSEYLLSHSLSFNDQIDYIIKNSKSETQKQLLYMILYPIASLLGEIDYVPDIKNTALCPYEKNEICYVSSLGTYCLKNALINSLLTGKQINVRTTQMTKGFWSNWNSDLQREALEDAKVCLKEIC